MGAEMEGSDFGNVRCSMSYILASQSPRRRELLEQMGILNLRSSRPGEEIWTPACPRTGWWRSSPARRRRRWPPAGPDDLVIAADTVVAVDGRVLGKPADPEEAVRMLPPLSGREHTVYTGVTVRRGEGTVTGA